MTPSTCSLHPDFSDAVGRLWEGSEHPRAVAGVDVGIIVPPTSPGKG
jgi:hypothetical protein